MAIASNVIVLWTGTNGTIPSGWSRETSLDAKYPKGTAAGVDPGTTGGSLTHTHAFTHTHTAAHTHTIPTSSGGTGSTARDTGTVRPPVAHTHTSGNTVDPATDLASDNPTSGTQSSEPAYFETIFIKSDGTPTGIPVDAVALWNDTTAPSGWNLCDAGGGRPDMRGVFLKGAAAAGNGGGTGGAATHSGHTIPSHTHGTNFSHAHPNVTSAATAAGMVGGNISGGQAGTATSGHTHVITVVTQATDAITGNTDTASGSGGNEPPYVLQGFIQNNNAGANIPDKIIALWVGTLATIPTDWALCDGTGTTPDLRGQYVKGATTLAGVGGTGGSTTHTHTVTNHTHAVAAHTHTLTHADGAGSNETAGAVNCSTTAHTHTWGPTGSSSFTSGSGSPTSVDNQAATEPPFSTVAFIQYTVPVDPQTHRGPVHTRLTKLASILTIGATFATNLLLTTLAPVAPSDPPFRQKDWPIQPKLAVQRLADAPRNLLLTLPPGSLPLNQKSWPSPLPLRQLSITAPPNLLETLLATIERPFVQEEWPTLPRVLARPVDQQRNLLAPLLAPPFVQEDWPRRPLPDQDKSVFETRNLLVTTLATTVAPFRQTHWPKLQRPPDRSDELAYLNLSIGTGQPFNQTDWPIQPKPAVLRPPDATRNVLLTLPPGALPPTQKDWPRIQLPDQDKSVFESRNLLASLLAPPFNQKDWPRLQQLDLDKSVFETRNLLVTTLAPTAAPFRQTNWPKLQRLLDRNDELSYLNLSIGTDTGVPFSQTNWPIPLKWTLLRPADATRNVLLTLPPGSLPKNQSNWPRVQPPDQDKSIFETRNLLVTTLAPTAAPFSQENWPIQPQLARLRTDPGANLFETLLATTERPFVQRDWALIPKFVTLRPAEPTPNILLRLPPGRLAFSQTSWPIQPRHAVNRLADAPRNITVNLPAPQAAGGGIKHKRKWRRT